MGHWDVLLLLPATHNVVSNRGWLRAVPAAQRGTRGWIALG